METRLMPRGALLACLLVAVAVAAAAGGGGCGGACGACARRYGCMTPAWGRCCTQFFSINGKRSAPVDHKRSWSSSQLIHLMRRNLRELQADLENPYAMYTDNHNALLPATDDSSVYRPEMETVRR